MNLKAMERERYEKDILSRHMKMFFFAVFTAFSVVMLAICFIAAIFNLFPL